jgi:hypothetical protein
MGLSVSVGSTGEDRLKCSFTMPARVTSLNQHGARRNCPLSLFTVSVLCTAPESCGSGLRSREQACRNLTEDLLVVRGYRPLHMNASTLNACFLCQPLELTLKKDFHLLRRQEGNGNSSGLARLGLDFYAVWGFVLLRFWSHAIPLFLE